MDESFETSRSLDHVLDVVGREETLVSLLPEAKAEIVERAGDRITARAHYSALGQEGTATFHFDYRMDGSVRFEKVCDGNVWEELRGGVSIEESGDGCLVTIEMSGRTKSLVPEFTVRVPMKEQIEQMASALQQKIEAD